MPWIECNYPGQETHALLQFPNLLSLEFDGLNLY